MIEQHREDPSLQPISAGFPDTNNRGSYLALIDERLPVVTNIAIIIVVLLALLMYFVKEPTHIKAEITAKGATFVVGSKADPQDVQVVGSLEAQGVTVSDFRFVRFKPSSLEMISTTPCLIQTNNQHVKIDIPYEEWVTRWPSVTLEKLQNIKKVTEVQNSALSVQGIKVKQSSTVKLNVTNDKETLFLSVQVKDKEMSTKVLASDQFKLIATNCLLVKDNGTPFASQCKSKDIENTYKVRLPKGENNIEIEGQPKSVQYVLTTTADNKSVFPSGVIPITGIHFNDQGDEGKEVSLIERGSISYPDHKDVKPVELRKAQSLNLKVTDPFQVSEITQDKDNNLIKFSLDGTADEAKTDYGFINNDLRLSVLRSWWENSALGQLLIIMIPLTTALLKAREWFIKFRQKTVR